MTIDEYLAKLDVKLLHLHTSQGVEEHPAITLLEVLDRIETMIKLEESQP